MKKFSLCNSSIINRVDNGLPISFKVYEYFETFIIEEVLKPKKIILNAKPNAILAFSSISGGQNLSKRVAAFKPRHVGDSYFSLISIPGDIIAEATDPYLRTIELIFEGITLFFTENFKSIKVQFMNNLWKKVDLNYLLSLTYPATESEMRPPEN